VGNEWQPDDLEADLMDKNDKNCFDSFSENAESATAYSKALVPPHLE